MVIERSIHNNIILQLRMKKVLHLAKYFIPVFGGIETFMEALMAQQRKSGLVVSAIVHADELQSDCCLYEWRGCRIHEVKSYGKIVFTPIAPSYYSVILRVLNEESPDIIHVHMPHVSPFWLLFSKIFEFRFEDYSALAFRCAGSLSN